MPATTNWHAYTTIDNVNTVYTSHSEQILITNLPKI